MARHTGRATIGLYNTYDNLKLREAHRRAIARAGPLAYAFDMNLALIGFPLEKGTLPRDISAWVRETTSIGNSGEFFTEVEVGDRIIIIPEIKKGFPPQLGDVVATTCAPEPSEGVTVRELSQELASGRSKLLLFGLGPKGLPKKVKDIAKQHLDVTPSGTSLETCTAMGAVVSAVWTAMNSE